MHGRSPVGVFAAVPGPLRLGLRVLALAWGSSLVIGFLACANGCRHLIGLLIDELTALIDEVIPLGAAALDVFLATLDVFVDLHLAFVDDLVDLVGGLAGALAQVLGSLASVAGDLFARVLAGLGCIKYADESAEAEAGQEPAESAGLSFFRHDVLLLGVTGNRMVPNGILRGNFPIPV